jgi:hypothetical protein
MKCAEQSIVYEIEKPIDENLIGSEIKKLTNQFCCIFSYTIDDLSFVSTSDIDIKKIDLIQDLYIIHSEFMQ